tara:strand:+ start:262 stop:879 length:618 start_codon:yes stop_codon:yes gene_type:complete
MADKKKLPKPLTNFKGFLKDKGTFPAVNKKEVAKKLLKKGFRMTLGRTAQGTGIALVGGSIASMVANKIKKMKKKKNAMKKKMGGGMMQRPMGYGKGGIKDFISRVKGEKSANKVHSKDHPDVQNLAEKIYKKNVKKMFPLGNNTKRNTKIYDKAVTKAQRVADSMQSIMSKNRSKTEGSFSTGGEAKVRGMGAAIKGGKFQGVF